jgi:Na+/alanine symporter
MIWSVGDTLNGLMAVPNLIALLLLSGVAVEITKKHFRHTDLREPKMGKAKGKERPLRLR